jgi:hypothetical protein
MHLQVHMHINVCPLPPLNLLTNIFTKYSTNSITSEPALYIILFNFLQSATTWQTCKHVKWEVGLMSYSSVKPIKDAKPKEATFAYEENTYRYLLAHLGKPQCSTVMPLLGYWKTQITDCMVFLHGHASSK